MATTSYEDALQVVEQLTPDERRRLQDALADLDPHAVSPGTRQPTGAALVAMFEAQPSDPVAWEKIERIIEDECERIDTDTW